MRSAQRSQRDGRVGPNTYNAKAPANYVAGLGRGASGFTTQMDLGPAQSKDVEVSDLLGSRKFEGGRGLQHAPQGYRAGVGRGAAPLSKDSEADGDNRDYTQFNPETGYSQHSLFNTEGGKDDEEADRIYAGVDEVMARRHKRRREEQEEARKKDSTEKRPKLSEVLAPYKASLSKVSEEEWESIPEVGDHSLKYKAPEENFTPMPASFIEAQRRASSSGTSHSVVDGGTTSTFMPGARSSAHRSIDGLATTGGGGYRSGLVSGTKSIVSGQKSVDPKGYLTSMASLDAAAPDMGNVGDLQKNRKLFRSLRESNPNHGMSWISGAKLEESCGKLNEARNIIRQACNACPNDEEVWLEALRLHSPVDGRSIASQALRRLPKSVKLWMKASQLERGPNGTTTNKEKIVLRRALETIPNSVQLWEAAISLEEEEEDARIMLSRAVECVPSSVNMWLALAKLETYGRAKQVLNSARKELPTELKIWVTAAQLEESHGNHEKAEKVMMMGIKKLKSQGVTFGRDKWLMEANTCERESGLPITACSIIKGTLYVDIDDTIKDANKRKIWTNEANECMNNGCYECGRAIHEHLVQLYSKRRDVWLNFISYEREVIPPITLTSLVSSSSSSSSTTTTTTSSTAVTTTTTPTPPTNGMISTSNTINARVGQLMRRAVDARPTDVLLWLMAAKEAWKVCQDVDSARSLLEEAFQNNPNNEELLLAGSKIEKEEGEYNRARILLSRARNETPSVRVMIKSITIERLDGCLVDAMNLLNEGRKLYIKSDKIWIMSIQTQIDYYNQIRNNNNATDDNNNLNFVPMSIRNLCNESLIHCPNSIPLWLLACKIEEKEAGIIRARSMLEIGRQKNSSSDDLWLHAINLEIRSNNIQMAETLMSKALISCPSSGLLASKHIEMAPRGVRQSRALALLRSKRYDGDSTVLSAVAKMLWSLGKGSKARSWFEKAINANPDDGDVWSEYLAFEIHHGATIEQQNKLLQRCVEANPKHGKQLFCPIIKRIEIRKPLITVEMAIKEAAARILGPFQVK